MRDDKTDMQSAEKTDRLKLCTKPAIGSENTQSAPACAAALSPIRSVPINSASGLSTGISSKPTASERRAAAAMR